MSCDLDTSIVTCTNVYTEDGFGFSYTDSGTIKFGNAATYSTELLTISITATGTATDTAATKESTTGEKADAGASSTAARTTTAATSTSRGSGAISDTGSVLSTDASATKTETGSATDGGSTPSVSALSATQTGAASVSARYSRIVFLTIVGAAMVLI